MTDPSFETAQKAKYIQYCTIQNLFKVHIFLKTWIKENPANYPLHTRKKGGKTNLKNVGNVYFSGNNVQMKILHENKKK